MVASAEYGVVASLTGTRDRAGALPEREDHPADLEPLVAALAAAAIDTAAVGVAVLGRLLPVPAVTRHATVASALLESQDWLRAELTRLHQELPCCGRGIKSC